MARDLIRDMLSRASELLSQDKTIVEWFDPKNCEHRGAFQIFLETKSWPDGFIPENVSLTSGWEDQLAKKLQEGHPNDNLQVGDTVEILRGSCKGLKGKVVDILVPGEEEDFPQGQIDVEVPGRGERHLDWNDVKRLGTIEGKVPSKDDNEEKILKKLTEAGIKENEIREIWVVLRPSKQSTMDDIVSKSTPRRLMTMAKGGLSPYDLIGIYDNAMEAREKGSDLLNAVVAEKKVNEGVLSDLPHFEEGEKESSPLRGKKLQLGKGSIDPKDPKWLYAIKTLVQRKEEHPDWDWSQISQIAQNVPYPAFTKITAYIDSKSQASEGKIHEGPIDSPEAGAGLKDPGFEGGGAKDTPGEDEEAPVGDLEVDDQNDAVEADFDKIYLGQDDTTHYYVVAKKGDTGETEDLLVTDQEGKELFSAKENNVETRDVGQFILAALDSDKVKIRELERGVVLQYLVPKEEEELDTEEEEDLEGEGSEGDEVAPKAGNEPPETKNPDQERPMESKISEKKKSEMTNKELRAEEKKRQKPLILPTTRSKRDQEKKESKLSETISVKDSKGQTFSVQIVDEGSKDVVVQINNREYRFKPDFVALYEMDGGKLTEQGLQDLATELLSHLREDEYAEVVGSGVQEDLDPSVTKEVGEDTLLQRAQQLRAKKDRTPDDDATLQQLENELKTRGQRAAEGKVPDKDDDDAKIIKKLTERTTPREGDIVQVLNSDGNSVVIPHAKVLEVDTTESDEGFTVRLEGEPEDEWYDNTSYQFKILEPAEESKVKHKENGSKVEEGRGEELYEEAVQLVVDMIAKDRDVNSEVVIKKVMQVYRIDQRTAVDIYNRANDEYHLDTGETYLGEATEKDGLAKKAGKKPANFDKGQLAAGTKVEMEHTNEQSKAQQIAMDHLTEDPHYYTKLKKVENESKVREGEYSDMAAGGQTKEVFQVEFVLDNGEKRRTRVMAFDDVDARRMLTRQKGVKSIVGVRPVSGRN